MIYRFLLGKCSIFCGRSIFLKMCVTLKCHSSWVAPWASFFFWHGIPAFEHMQDLKSSNFCALTWRILLINLSTLCLFLPMLGQSANSLSQKHRISLKPWRSRTCQLPHALMHLGCKRSRVGRHWISRMNQLRCPLNFVPPKICKIWWRLEFMSFEEPWTLKFDV